MIKFVAFPLFPHITQHPQTSTYQLRFHAAVFFRSDAWPTHQFSRHSSLRSKMARPPMRAEVRPLMTLPAFFPNTMHPVSTVKPHRWLIFRNSFFPHLIIFCSSLYVVTRQKVHVNMWNKADIRAVLLSNETSTAHFHAVFKTWPTFQELTSIVSFRRRWSQRNFSENRNIQGNQSKDVLNKI